MNEGIHLDLDTWIVPGQIRMANLCRGYMTVNKRVSAFQRVLIVGDWRTKCVWRLWHSTLMAHVSCSSLKESWPWATLPVTSRQARRFQESKYFVCA